MSSYVYGLVAIILFIIILGVALDYWLLLLEVYLITLYMCYLEFVLIYIALIIYFHPLEYCSYYF